MLAYGYGIICANNLLSTLIRHCNVFSQQCFDHCYEHSIVFMLHFHLLPISLNGWLLVSVYDKQKRVFTVSLQSKKYDIP